MSQDEANASSSTAIESLPNYPDPLIDSYTYHSKCPITPGKYIMGVDEAGRGPVLGPMVYGVAFCPVEYKEQLDGMGFNVGIVPDQPACDMSCLLIRASSASPHSLRPPSLPHNRTTLRQPTPHPAHAPSIFGFSSSRVRANSPQDLSASMLSRPPTNLNACAQQATVGLIKLVMNQLQITISELYVDALGPPAAYQKYLSECFPEIDKISVETKADAKYKIVGAASVAAKVTRDAWIDGWVWEEGRKGKGKEDVTSEGGEMEVEGEEEGEGEESSVPWSSEFGSGYPSDPKTKAWVDATLDPTFGYPSFSRFSWATIKVQLDKSAHKVQWIDDGHTIAKAFESTKPADKGRCAVTKDLAIRSVGSL
ncbi:hypothetical protein FRB90_011574 [Tulasnella sp. 427]|nr:hypothetical protein FRB90_011574 [Tulasnella sp. 427]